VRRAIVAAASALLVVGVGPPAGAHIGAHDWTLGGRSCGLIDVPVQAPPVGVPGSCPGVRPGAVVLSDVGQCTFNFLFAGSDGHRWGRPDTASWERLPWGAMWASGPGGRAWGPWLGAVPETGSASSPTPSSGTPRISPSSIIVSVGVHLGSIVTGGVDGGAMGITRLGPQVARAGQALGTGLTLQTASAL
jgi:hypothetical protein